MALFAWAHLSGINQSGGTFDVTILPVALAVVGIVLASVSYFLKVEIQTTTTAALAYVLSICAILVLIFQTGGVQSIFIALWMIASIFSGVFGYAILVSLFTATVGFSVYVVSSGIISPELISTIVLAGFLPIVMSFVLWHKKTSTEKNQEESYHEMANERDQASNKAGVVIDAISDGVIAISNSGQIELINPAAQRIVGWGNQDAMNLDYKSVLKLLSTDGHELEKSSDPVFSVLSTNQPTHKADVVIQTSSGKKLDGDVFVSPLGKLGSGAIIVFRDVTKERAEGKAQAEFISTASHEMRTPVASIEGYLGLALNPATAKIDDKARDFIGKAHEAAQHLGRLFSDLLDITKADDGRLQNNPKVIDLVSFTHDVVDGLRMKAQEKGLRVFYKPTDSENAGGVRNVAPVFYVNADADHLREVLSNLVENAIKYTPEGQVWIDVQASTDEHVAVSIKDSGIGIPTEDIPHLFQKFYRVDNSDTREIGGTGLGLYLCRRLVETMSGRIWVDSEYKKGSTFFVELPRISHAEANRLIDASTGDQIVTKKAAYSTSEGLAADADSAITIDTIEDEDSPVTSSETPIILNRKQRSAPPTPVTPEVSSEPPAKTSSTAPEVTPAKKSTSITVTTPVAQESQAAKSAPEAATDPLVGGPVVAAPEEALRTQTASVTPGMPLKQDGEISIEQATDVAQKLIANFLNANPGREAPTATPSEVPRATQTTPNRTRAEATAREFSIPTR